METKIFSIFVPEKAAYETWCLLLLVRILATIYDAGNYHTGRILWNGAHHASCRNQRHL